eukprot:TRINITY_DN14058_c0_g4_i3.p1 TRINITY_DN14058_c0_g4~~TRINITY_DN14058_c0_g4_i3.p1  ORF type:complete len:460 (+),score=99.19 TRINITY_DN14058_c0_g4_i3:2550-3929(+)
MNKLISRKIGTEIELGPKVGNDGFSKIRIAYKDGKEYAVKYTKCTLLGEIKTLSAQLSAEIAALTRLANPHIPKLHEHSHVSIYTKQYSHSSAQTKVSYCLLDKPLDWNLMDVVFFARPLSEEVARFYFKQLLNAVGYIHGRGYAHGNLKLKYLLLNRECNLILSGFSQAKDLSLSKEQMGREVLVNSGQIQEESSNPMVDDIFSLGCILFIMLFKSPPFITPSPTDMLYKFICEHKLSDFWKQFSKIKVSSEAKDLISSLIAYEAIFRPSLCEIECSPWLQEKTPTLEEVQKEIKALMQVTEQRAREEALKRRKRKSTLEIATGIKVSSLNTRGLDNSSTLEKNTKEVKGISEGVLITGGTCIYSMESIEEIEHSLMSYLIVAASSCKIDNVKHKVHPLYIIQIEARFKTKCEPLKIKIRIVKTRDSLYCIGVRRVHGEASSYVKEFERIKTFVQEEL